MRLALLITLSLHLLSCPRTSWIILFASSSICLAIFSAMTCWALRYSSWFSSISLASSAAATRVAATNYIYHIKYWTTNARNQYCVSSQLTFIYFARNGKATKFVVVQIITSSISRENWEIVRVKKEIFMRKMQVAKIKTVFQRERDNFASPIGTKNS